MRRRYPAFVAACTLLVIFSGALTERGHTIAGIALAVLVLGLAIPFHPLAAVAIAAAAIEFIPGVPVLHAATAPVVFAATAALAAPLTESAPKSMRGLLLSLPPLVLLQITLGASYRHEALGVLPHMVDAMLVAGLVLVVCVKLLARGALRREAAILLTIVLIQVMLGASALVMRLLNLDKSPLLHVSAAIHITTASLLLATVTWVARSTRSTGPS